MCLKPIKKKREPLSEESIEEEEPLQQLETKPIYKHDDDIWERVDEIFRKFDTDMNGLLDFEEAKHFFLEKWQSTDPTQVDAIFNEIDVNVDGKITREELFNYLKSKEPVDSNRAHDPCAEIEIDFDE